MYTGSLPVMMLSAPLWCFKFLYNLIALLQTAHKDYKAQRVAVLSWNSTLTYNSEV